MKIRYINPHSISMEKQDFFAFSQLRPPGSSLHGTSGGMGSVMGFVSHFCTHGPRPLAVIADPSYVGTEEWQEGYLKQTTSLVGCFHGFDCDWCSTGRLFDHFIQKILNPSELAVCCQLPSRWPCWTSSKMGNNYALHLVLRKHSGILRLCKLKAQPKHNKTSIVRTLPSGGWVTFSAFDLPRRHQAAK